MAAFRKELFLQPQDYEEGLFLDRKSDLYLNLSGHWEDKKKAEFVKDFIALANTATIFSRPTYLLLGLADNGEIIGLEQYLEPFGYPESSLDKIRQEVEKKFAQIIKEYISSIPIWQLTIEELKKEDDNHAVPLIQIEIQPTQSKTFFHVKKRVKGGRETFISEGMAWRRHGESNSNIDPIPLFENEWNEIISRPHILPSQWQNYFTSVLNERIFMEADAIDPWIPLHVQSGKTLETEFESFLANNNLHLLVIEGVAGSGKSVFAKRKTYQFAQDGRQEIENIRNEQFFLPPQNWIPVYFPLTNRQISTTQDLIAQVLRELNHLARFWDVHPPREPEAIFRHSPYDEQQNLNWLIFLDGLDELLGTEQQRDFLRVLREFLNDFPNLKIVLLTRPHIVKNEWREWTRTKTVILRQLSSRQIREYIEAKIIANAPTDIAVTTLASEIERFFKSNDDLWKLCSTPYHLDAAIQSLGLGDVLPSEDVIPEIDIRPQTDNGFISANKDVSTHLDELLNVRPIETKDLTLEEPFESENQLEQIKRTHGKFDDSSPAPLRLSNILERIYSALWTRETKRHRITEAESIDWEDRTSEFASNRCSSKSARFLRRTALKTLGSERLFLWLLSVGILDANRRGTYSFYTELTKLYFAAKWIMKLFDVGENDLADQLIRQCRRPELYAFIQSQQSFSGGYE